MEKKKYYIEKQKALIRTIDKCEDDFQSIAMKIGPGTLVLSLTLLSLLPNFQQSMFLLILFIGWLCLIAAIGWNFFASQDSSLKAQETIHEINKEFERTSKGDLQFNDNEIRENLKRRNKIINRHSNWIVALTLLGIGCIFLFTSLHIYIESSVEVKKEKAECCCPNHRLAEYEEK